MRLCCDLILSLFRNKFNKFNKTGAQMLDPTHHMTLKLLRNCIYGKNAKILPSILDIVMDVII